jgi:hypothetical protein
MPKRCPACHLTMRTLLAEDRPGEHVYVHCCPKCHREGRSWVVRHHRRRSAWRPLLSRAIAYLPGALLGIAIHLLVAAILAGLLAIPSVSIDALSL